MKHLHGALREYRKSSNKASHSKIWMGLEFLNALILFHHLSPQQVRVILMFWVSMPNSIRRPVIRKFLLSLGLVLASGSQSLGLDPASLGYIQSQLVYRLYRPVSSINTFHKRWLRSKIVTYISSHFLWKIGCLCLRVRFHFDDIWIGLDLQSASIFRPLHRNQAYVKSPRCWCSGLCLD